MKKKHILFLLCPGSLLDKLLQITEAREFFSSLMCIYSYEKEYTLFVQK
jgi:hypothetical protein